MFNVYMLTFAFNLITGKNYMNHSIAKAFRIDLKHFKLLKSIAKKEKKSISKVIREIIIKHLKSCA